MKTAVIVAGAVALALAAVNPALARSKHRGPAARCVDRPYEFSWRSLLPGQPAPQPNGCAPPVYQYGQYVGQDPDPNIRFQLRRDPGTGYSALNNN
ncbi:MAG TPA: hypothetical protein VFA57_07365 [Pseudolabrys sp.]|jgi:hypothetical protein|nr:hypothetical protein [Pseudolabrys sp.]